mmetsp:Transcript_30721/g.91057  ORF Transcript_30721/g.91057 Transcript_30721/m.91057 type:complete len:257 (+) Transcript_30721:3722-4492(+)
MVFKRPARNLHDLFHRHRVPHDAVHVLADAAVVAVVFAHVTELDDAAVVDLVPKKTSGHCIRVAIQRLLERSVALVGGFVQDRVDLLLGEVQHRSRLDVTRAQEASQALGGVLRRHRHLPGQLLYALEPRPRLPLELGRRVLHRLALEQPRHAAVAPRAGGAGPGRRPRRARRSDTAGCIELERRPEHAMSARRQRPRRRGGGSGSAVAYSGLTSMCSRRMLTSCSVKDGGGAGRPATPGISSLERASLTRTSLPP